MKIKNLILFLAALLLSSVPTFAQILVFDPGHIGGIPIDDPSGYLSPQEIEEYDGVVINGVVYAPFPFSDENVAMVVGYTDGLPDNATIKSKIKSFGEEYNVIGFWDCAFAGCTSLTSVAIPNSVEYIGPRAFAGCENLEIIIPSSVENIGEDAFVGVKHVVNASFCKDEEDWGAVKLDGFTDEPAFECELEGGFECVVAYEDDEIWVIINGYHGEGGDITIPYGVSAILNGAFGECESLTSVKIPETVKTIREAAFIYCYNLVSVNIPNGVKSIGDGAFYCCSSLTSVTIPNSVEHIGEDAFTGCTSLASVTIPNSVVTIDAGAFYGCTALASVTIPNSVEYIIEGAFAGCENLESLTIPASVIYIGDDAFSGVKSIINLSSLTDENNWGALALNSEVDENGFVYEANSEKKKLLAYIGNNSEVTIPDDVEIISEYAFLNHGVETVIIPEDAAVTSIEDWAFAGVTNVINNNSYTDGQPWGAWKLNGDDGGFVYSNENGEVILTAYNGNGGDITIPYGVTAIGMSAFGGCASLTSVKIPETVTAIGMGAFEGCESLTSVKIPETVKTIGEEAFINCHNLVSVNIPNGVESIEPFAFAYCENLESVTINEGVETIGEGAFEGCFNLETVTVPSSVTSIGDWAFDGVLIVNNNSSCTDEDNWGAVAVNGIRDGDFIYDANSEKKKLLAYIGENDNVTIPADVEIIGKKAVYWAEFVTIPENAAIINIEDWAFARVGNVINESSYTEGQPWGAWALNGDDGGFVYEYGDYYILTAYTGEGGDIVIPYGVNVISEGVFAECESLTSVKIPETVWYINEGAFAGCESLTSVTIPDGVETIGADAFYGCYNLKYITIPSSVKTIGPLAFDGVKFVINNSSCTEGQPWGAEMVVNGEIDEDGFVYAPYTNKTVLLAYIGDGGDVTIPETVKTIGEGAFAYDQSITSVTIPNGVETIGDYAFCECYNLKLITVPSSVTSIGDWAFGGVLMVNNNSSCTDEYNWGALMVVNGEIDGEYVYGLNTDKTVLLAYIGEGGDVTIPETVKTIGNYAFAFDQSITSVTIPNGVETIGDYAFFKCYNLNLITVPSSVETIGDYAFCECFNLKSLTIPSSVESIGEWAFSGVKYVINNSSCTDENNWGAVAVNGERDGDFVYESNTNKTVLLAYIGSDSEITIPESVRVIGEWAFMSCTSLTSVTIPEGVTVIGEGAFEYCNSLTSVTIPESVTSIGDRTFYGCESLTSVTIPGSVESIGEYAFYKCKSLVSVTIPESVETIGEWAFGYCSNLESINIPLSVTTIGNNPFSYCSKIESITIPEGVTTIGEYEFAYLTGMKSVTIPHGVTTLCNDAFYGCTSLTTVTIPESVTSIGQQVFSSNGSGGSIKEVYCSANPEALDRIDNLPRDGKITYHVPAEYLESWMFYHWSYVGDDEGRHIWFANNITFVADVKSINDEDITINIASQTYTGNDLTPVIEVKDGEETLVEGIDYTVALPEGGCANAGNYTVTITGMKRYYKSVEKTFTINPAEVTVTAENKTKTFGNAEPEFTATISGLVNNESESLITYTIGRDEGENVGEYAITPAGAEVQGNYAVSFEAAKLTINPATASVTHEGATTNYETLPAALDAAQDGDLVTLLEDYQAPEKAWPNVLTLYSSNGMSLTIDLNGHTIDGSTATYAVQNVIYCYGVDLTICDNSQSGGGTIRGGKNDGIYYYVSDPTMALTLRDVTISDCGAHGVIVPCGDLVISGGAIKDNGGTGVKFQSTNRTFTLSGDAEISGNGSSNYYGGGVSIEYNSTMLMQGGTITGNTASSGGGIYIADGSLTMTGGTITENTAGDAGGVYVPGTVVTVSGTASIFGNKLTDNSASNVHLSSNSRIKFGGELDAASRIGLSHTYTSESDVKYFPLVYIENFKDNATTDNFFSDDEERFGSLMVYGDDLVFAKTIYTVTFDTNGGSEAPAAQTFPGFTEERGVETAEYDADKLRAIRPADPTKDGYSFGGWMLNGEAYDFSAVVASNITLTATYEAIPATAPTISTQPGNLTLTYNYTTGNTLTVAANSIDGHNLSYQWYSNSSNSNEGGTAISGATNANYSVPVGKSAGTTEYYYCVVTATRTDNSQTAATASNTVTVTINPAAVTVTADNKEMTFGDSEPVLTATVSGLVNDESASLITYTIGRAKGENAGEYKITPSGEEVQGNYKVTYVEGTLTINKAVPAYTLPTIAAQPCNAKLADIQLGSGFAFAAGSAELAIGENKRKVVFTPENTDNYKVVENIEVTINVNDHVHAEAVAENPKEATCTEAGSVDSVVYCTVCNAELSRKTVEIPVIPHTAGEAVAENLKAATCTEAGSVDSVVYCTVCKKELSRKTVEIPVIPHTAGEAVAENLKAATCTEAGSVDSVVYCTVCNAELSRKTVEIPVISHKADSIAIENVVAATYEAAGSYDSVVYCSVCKVELSRTTIEVPQLVAQKIEAEVVISQLDYTVGDSLKLDGGKIIIATSDSTTAEVVITPEMISGFNPDSVGVQQVTVEFTVNNVVYTTTFEVEVKEAEVIEVVAKSVALSAPTKVVYKKGEQLDVAGGKLTVTYSDGTTQDVELKADMVSGFDADKVGTQKLTVTLKIDKVTLTATFDVTVEADDNTAISDDEAAAVNIYAYGNTIVVENAENDIYVYDAMGRLIVETPHCDVSTEIRINRAGVYIVKTGNTAKRVMINE